jgi:Domain of unknown function (DUF3859)
VLPPTATAQLLARITVPTHIIHGEADPLAPVASERRTCATRSTARRSTSSKAWGTICLQRCGRVSQRRLRADGKLVNMSKCGHWVDAHGQAIFENHFMRIAIAASALAIFLLSGCATTPRPIQGFVDWSGTFTRKLSLPDVESEGRFQLVERTKRIPAKLGVQFGVAYYFDLAPGATVVRDTVWTFPARGVKNTDTNAIEYEHRVKHDWECTRIKTCIKGWAFDRPADVVPGIWRLDIYVDGKSVIQQTFEVIEEPTPEAALGAIRGTLKMEDAAGSSSCSGRPVALFPSLFAKEIQSIVNKVRRTPAPEDLNDTQRSFVRFTTCDAQSTFSFSGLEAFAWVVLADMHLEGDDRPLRTVGKLVITKPGATIDLNDYSSDQDAAP